MAASLILLPASHGQTAHGVGASSSAGNPGNASVTNGSIAPASEEEIEMVPRQGINAALVYSSAHDSQAGWSHWATPYLSYGFNKNFSMEMSCPIYILRFAANTEAAPTTKKSLLPIPLRGETGDTLVATHAQFSNSHFDYMATLSFTVPTGDTLYGLSTGRMTFDLTHDFLRAYGRFGPGVELGVGDSSALASTRVIRDFTSLGPLAHFQLGSTVDLPLHMLFEADAYEQLPIGDQKIYTTVVLKKKTTTEVIGTGLSEDNGFTTNLDIPLHPQIILSGFYNRSRRFGIDTAGVSLTFLLRNPRMPSPDTDQELLDALMKK
jgi:hypothetical protein